MSISEELEKLQESKAAGVLTPEEFEKLKGRLIDGEKGDIGSAAEDYVSVERARFRLDVIGFVVTVVFIAVIWAKVFSVF